MVDWDEVGNFLAEEGADEWFIEHVPESWFVGNRIEGEGDEGALVEIMGRLCYKSWEPGLNPNVTKVRTDQDDYIGNIINVGHGSVVEHPHISFIFNNVSRVFTHELVRHRHENISQESLRFVRLNDIPFWFPDWSKEDQELYERAREVVQTLEDFQLWMAEHFALDDPGVPFAEKKHKTSFMRRFAPIGVATKMGWTVNVRGLRHIIQMRTAPGAEEEIRLVFGMVAERMAPEMPALFQDAEVSDDGVWTFGTPKL